MPHSTRKVYALCQKCKRERILCYSDYRYTSGRCHRCCIGFQHSSETRKRFSIMRKGTRMGSKNSFYNKTHTEKTKQLMSENHYDNSKENHPQWKGGSELASIRRTAKRRRFGYIVLNRPHVGFHGHHLDYKYVMFVPKELHKSVWHSVTKNIRMDDINNKVCDWYLEFQDVKVY